MAEAMIRSSWMAMKSADLVQDPALEEVWVSWASEFWNSNRRLSPCQARPPGNPEGEPPRGLASSANSWSAVEVLCALAGADARRLC